MFEVKVVNTSELPVFCLNVIVAATKNFSKENELERGGFGPIYKGVLEDGQEIAVKRLSVKSGQGVDEFKNEIILIQTTLIQISRFFSYLSQQNGCRGVLA